MIYYDRGGEGMKSISLIFVLFMDKNLPKSIYKDFYVVKNLPLKKPVTRDGI
jgi:hypothetical protein